MAAFCVLPPEGRSHVSDPFQGSFRFLGYIRRRAGPIPLPRGFRSSPCRVASAFRRSGSPEAQASFSSC
jgi:hypothetical protein